MTADATLRALVKGPGASACFDPLWHEHCEPTPLERQLLDSAALRRLKRVRHAGVAWLTSRQTYSRFDHTVGVFALTQRYLDDDPELRVAALLHDAGHLPLSHTFEGIADLDHHAQTERTIVEMDGVIGAHGLDSRRVLQLATGEEPSPLKPPDRLLGFDRLDALIRSACAEGWNVLGPTEILGGCRLANVGFALRRSVQDELVRLLVRNAHAQLAAANVGPVGIVRSLGRRLLGQGHVSADAFARWGDEETWGAMLDSPSTSKEASRLLEGTGHIDVRVAGDGPVESGLEVVEVPTQYLDRPTQDVSSENEGLLRSMLQVPHRFAVGWAAQHDFPPTSVSR